MAFTRVAIDDLEEPMAVEVTDALNPLVSQLSLMLSGSRLNLQRFLETFAYEALIVSGVQATSGRPLAYRLHILAACVDELVAVYVRGDPLDVPTPGCSIVDYPGLPSCRRCPI